MVISASAQGALGIVRMADVAHAVSGPTIEIVVVDHSAEARWVSVGGEVRRVGHENAHVNAILGRGCATIVAHRPHIVLRTLTEHFRPELAAVSYTVSCDALEKIFSLGIFARKGLIFVGLIGAESDC